MEKSLIEQLKQKLEKDKATIEKELSSFAKKDPKLKGDWDSQFPRFGEGAGSERLEEEADEVEEYANRLPVEFSLELKLKDIVSALKKIENGSYGKCEKCGEQIPEERLKIYPEARFCLKCEQEGSKKNAF